MKKAWGPNLVSPKIMRPEEAAYCAGLLDGEGTITIVKHSRKVARLGYRYQAEVMVANTFYPVLEHFVQLCGNGRIVATYSKPHHKPGYRVQFSPNQIRHVLPQLRPYLVVKAAQADLVLEFLGFATIGKHLTDAEYQRTESLRTNVRALNKRGVDVAEQAVH
jgi:hypothetical protein